MSLPKPIKRVWGISEVGFSMMAGMETTFFVFFLTDVALLPLPIAAVISGSAALVDSLSAVVAGIVIDKTNFKNGKYRPWLLICPPLSALCFLLVFSKIGGDLLAAIFIAIGYILSHFIWNICWTANRSLIPVLTNDPEEKSWLSGRIAIGSNLGKLVSAYLVPIMSTAMIATVGGVGSYTLIALLVGVCFVICYYIHYRITKGFDAEHHVGKSVSFKDMGRAIVKNEQLLAWFCHDFIRLIAYYGMAALTAYYCRIVLDSPTSTSVILCVFYLGCIVGSYLSPYVMKKLGSKKTTILGMCGWLVFQLSMLFIPFDIIIAAIVLGIGQVFFGIAYGLTANIYSICGAYGEWKTGESARGVSMAFCALAIKFGVALRDVLVVVALGFIGYSATAAVTPAIQSGVSMLYAVFPVVFIVIAFVPIIFFKLTDKRAAEMEDEIKQRIAEKEAVEEAAERP